MEQAQDTVNIQERWYSDHVDVYVSSPTGWKLLRTETFDRVPFVFIGGSPSTPSA